VNGRFDALTKRQALRRKTLKQLRQLTRRGDELREVEAEEAKTRALVDALETALKTTDHRREVAGSVARAAVESRTAIMRQVFNTSLNRVWRDLFVRLAPGEPYVPAFSLPEGSNHIVSAQLLTLHRSGGRGGTPGTMLSAGKLNTAALTLFLALHLSAQPRLPWLLFDDPVQSMDEVHVSQFAALLRTLSKEHGRQVVIAVHDRPLFEYLTLELSPAFPGDRLITVELSRPMDGDSLAEPTYVTWEADKAFVAT
jgi:exonuclease SbcC